MDCKKEQSIFSCNSVKSWVDFNSFAIVIVKMKAYIYILNILIVLLMTSSVSSVSSDFMALYKCCYYYYYYYYYFLIIKVIKLVA